MRVKLITITDNGFERKEYKAREIKIGDNCLALDLGENEWRRIDYDSRKTSLHIIEN